MESIQTDTQTLPIRIKISFHPKLRPLLHPKNRGKKSIDYQVNHQTTIKDLIESLRVPHPEVGKITIRKEDVDFSYKVTDGDQIFVSPLIAPIDPCTPHILRPVPLPKLRFLTDANVGKLCSLLRMVGLDTLYFPHKDDSQLADIVVREKCVLLSRDIGLLKRKKIVHGHYVWNQKPQDQLREILHLYDLKRRLNPFSRCMLCNGKLTSVAKETVIDHLEPLTKKYYNTFYQCSECNRVYWSGSHKDGMKELLRKIGLT